MNSKQKLHLGYGDYLRFRDMVMERSGLYFPEKKRHDLELGLAKALETSPIEQVGDYYQFLSEKTAVAEAEFSRLINLLTIGETHFFRDTPQFNAIATAVLPQLIERKREEAQAAGAMPQLRLWSAGCASGEEPYSLAILLYELIPDITNWHILILGTDINTDILAKARQAVYSDWSFRESRALALRSIYFSRQEKRYHLHENIKRMVTFAQHNLIEDTFPAVHQNTIAMDLIICRNVMIYFATETVQMLAKRFYEALLPAGWFIVGHSEPSLLTYRSFQAKMFQGTLLYQKTGEATRLPDEWLSNTVSAPKPAPSPQPPTQSAIPVAKPAPPRRTGLLPKEPTPHQDPYHEARRLLSQGQIVQAIRLLEDNIDQLPTTYGPYAHCLLARAYADRGQWQTARQLAKQATAANSILPEPYLILAMIDEQEGNIEDAITNLKKVLYLDSRHVIAHFNLGMLYQQQDQTNHAQRAFRNARNLLLDQPPDHLLPDSGEVTVKRLLNTINQFVAPVAR